MDVGRLAGRLALSTGQALTRRGKSDDEAFRLPLPRDFSSELSGHGRPDKKLAESVIADRGSDRRPAELCPINDDGSRTSSAVNLDLSGSRGKRAPYFTEFVANSCSSSARLESTGPKSPYRNQRSKAGDFLPRLGEAR